MNTNTEDELNASTNRGTVISGRQETCPCFESFIVISQLMQGYSDFPPDSRFRAVGSRCFVNFLQHFPLGIYWLAGHVGLKLGSNSGLFVVLHRLTESFSFLKGIRIQFVFSTVCSSHLKFRI